MRGGVVVVGGGGDHEQSSQAARNAFTGGSGMQYASLLLQPNERQ